MLKNCDLTPTPTKTFLQTEIDGNGTVLNQKRQTVRYFDEEKGYLFWLNKETVRTFKGFGLPTTLTESETARLYRLSLTMHKGSNLICYRSGNANKAMNLKKIAEYLNITPRQAASFINQMICKRILGRVKVRIGKTEERQYYMNPIFFFNGKWLNVNLYFLFKKDLDGILPEWVKERFSSYGDKSAADGL